VSEEREETARRLDALKRLGVKIRWTVCNACQDRFLDPELFGRRPWKIVRLYGEQGSQGPGTHGYYCSQACAERQLRKINAAGAWIEGFES
jgi:hypothetical protein